MYKTSTQSNKYCKTTVQKVWEVKSKKKKLFAECHILTLGI